MHRAFIEEECEKIDDFWSFLSPLKPLKPRPSNFIFRGQRNSNWELIPSILREGPNNPAKRIWGSLGVTSDNQIFAELTILEHFVRQCDALGLTILYDSVDLRQRHLNTQDADKFYLNPTEWPNKNLLEIMAVAQHHGVPTRLLDWTKRSFVAAYFAASSALENKHDWKEGERLAVWALDIETINLYKNISIIRVPGSASKNLAAQAGVFSLHRQEGERGKFFNLVPMEREFTSLPNTPLYKITLPVTESKSILERCELYGVTASSLFPSFDGAAKAVKDSINCWDKSDDL